MFMRWMEVLSKCDLFRGISPNELNIIFECLKPDVGSYGKNEWVAVAGEKFTGLGVVLAGDVVVAKENAAGKRIIVAVNSPGEIFGEMAAFSGEGVWPVTVAAREASTVMFLPAGKIVENCERSCLSHRQLITNMLKIVSGEAFMLNRKLEYMMIKSIRGKISVFLLEQYKRIGQATFMLPLKRNELADFLNVSRPSLSREMCRLRDEGVIDFYKNSIKIKDLDTLKRMAE
ncbi:MAG TPA: transcriptional regulator [Desulfotomaculum sp.]|nr:transcriptional regulator [Desulfotomaculum sp.]